MSTEYYLIPSVPFEVAREKIRAAGICEKALRDEGAIGEATRLALVVEGASLIFFKEPDNGRVDIRKADLIKSMREEGYEYAEEQVRRAGEAALERFGTCNIEKFALLVRIADILGVGVWSELGANMLDPESWGPDHDFPGGSDFLFEKYRREGVPQPSKDGP